METTAPHPDLPIAPDWSLFVGNAGSVLIWCAAFLYAISAIVCLLTRKSLTPSRWGPRLFTLGSVSLFSTFACLATLFINDRFEWKYVQQHSDRLVSWPYKLASVWSGQEGSFLLWATSSAIFGLLALRRAGPYRPIATATYAAFLASICGILTYESPYVLMLFEGKPVIPPDGVGLAPSLLNYWVIIHPPTIFLGFGSLTVLFAYAVAALAIKNPVDWMPIVRPWALISLALVGLGLCMGGFWAYETLGWGGFWAWDPVENTSFVPWCLLVCVVHGFLVQAARQRWHSLNLLFAGLPFLSFVYGTFLTRSGFLGDTSVHSFANMERAALYILTGIFAVSLLGFLGLWFAQNKALKSEFDAKKMPTLGSSREGAYGFASVLMSAFALATGFGMSVPLVQSLAGQKPKMVEEWLYHQVLPWIFIPTLILMAAGPFLSWRGTSTKDLLGKLYGPLCLTIFSVGIIMLISAWTPLAGEVLKDGKVKFLFGAFEVSRPFWTLCLAGLCLFVVMANLWRLGESFKRSKLGTAPFLAHIGVGVLMAGLILSRGLERKEQVLVQDKSQNVALNYVLSPNGPTGDLFDRNNKIKFAVQNLGQKSAPMEFRPGFYFRTGNDGQPAGMAWPWVQRGPLHDVYMALHAMEFNASDVIAIKPGGSADFDRFNVKFIKTSREGNPGQVGTKFGALLEATDTENHQTITLEPKWMIGDQGIEQIPALLGNEFFMTIQSMDADSQDYGFQLHFRQPLYAVELFIKPFTPLVWIGTGILTLAVFLSAIYRRPKDSIENPHQDTEVKQEAEELNEDALIPTA